MQVLFVTFLLIALTTAIQTPNSYWGGNLMRNGLQTADWPQTFIFDFDFFNHTEYYDEAKPLIYYDAENERDLIIVHTNGDTLVAVNAMNATIVWERNVTIVDGDLVSVDPADEKMYYFDFPGVIYQINPLTGETLNEWDVQQPVSGNFSTGDDVAIEVVDGIAILVMDASDWGVLFYNLQTSTPIFSTFEEIGSNEVWAPAINREDNVVIIADYNQGIRALNYKTAVLLWTFDLTDEDNYPSNHGYSQFNFSYMDEMPSQASFDADGNVAIILYCQEEATDTVFSALYVLDAADGSVISVTGALLDDESFYNQAVINFAPNSYAAGSYGEEIVVFNTSAGTVMRQNTTENFSDFDMPMIYNSVTGNFLAIAYYGGYVSGNIWERTFDIVDDDRISNYNSQISIGSDGTLYHVEDDNYVLVRITCDPAVGVYFYNSECIDTCPAGSRKAMGLMTCIPCEDNEYTNEEGACVACDEGLIPNDQLDGCVAEPTTEEMTTAEDTQDDTQTAEDTQDDTQTAEDTQDSVADDDDDDSNVFMIQVFGIALVAALF